MLNRVTLLFIIALLVSPLTLSQKKAILAPDGKLYEAVDGKSDVVPYSKVKGTKNSTAVNPIVLSKPNDLIDTLRIPGSGASTANFIVYSQDWIVQWFKAPADLLIQKVGVPIGENNANAGMEVKIVSVNLTEQQLNVQRVWWGYYEATGNGFNDITAFQDNQDRTGPWVPKGTNTLEPFGPDIWSDNGAGYPIPGSEVIVSSGTKVYNWVDLDIIGYADIKKDQIFGLAMKNTATNPSGDRFLVYYWPNSVLAGFKFYSDARGVTTGVDDWGWWSREFAWDIVAEVSIYGDLGPTIVEFDELASGPNVGPFTINANIFDTNPGNEAEAGIKSVVLEYTLDSATANSVWTQVEMTGTAPNFSGQIPAQATNHWVYYRIVATDVNDNVTTSLPVQFFVFGPTGADVLVIFNGFPSVSGYPQSYYFGHRTYQPALFWEDGQRKYFNHDRWAYGPIPDIEMLNNYTHIFEIWSGEGDYNDELIRQWLAADGSRNYYLSGEEYLGAQYGYDNQTFAAGDFEYDILGVRQSYNDITYAASTGQGLPTLITPVEGTLFGGPLQTYLNSLSPTFDSLMYNPGYEIGADNWQDAFEVVDGVEVDANVETRGVDNVANVMTKPTWVHRTLTGGNKIVFHSFDPISLNTSETSDFDYYHWVGYSQYNPAYQAAGWFGVDIFTGVKEVGGTPTTFALSQNYPNPFNPATIINFSIPELSKITLKVYDVLGTEVATLLNEEKTAGNYEVKFDASRLSSGVYFYSLSAGNTLITKKMMLMK